MKPKITLPTSPKNILAGCQFQKSKPKQQKIIDDVSDADRDDDWDDDDSGDTHCGKCDGTGIWSSGGNIECPYCNGSGTATE